MTQRTLLPGDPAPWFVARSTSADEYHFQSVAGRLVVLSFFGSLSRPASAAVLEALLSERTLFDDTNACLFGVSVDPQDKGGPLARELLPGVRWFWDFDLAVSRLYGVTLDKGDGTVDYRPTTFVLDERLRVLAILPFTGDARSQVAEVARLVAAHRAGVQAQTAAVAPVLLVPRVFEPALCRRLIEHYETHGGKDSGVMRERGAMTVGEYDHAFKRRRDQEIVDEALRKACIERIRRRLGPEIERAFAFRATRIERHIVACYDGASGGFFRAHRDNTSRATAHRRFAVTLNLNTGEYAGGELRFPEYGPRTYAAEAGGAVVFSCGMLHEATPVTTGRRYTYLPFLYDDDAARVREENRRFLANAD